MLADRPGPASIPVGREVRTLPVPTRQLHRDREGLGPGPEAADPRRADLLARPGRGARWCSISPGEHAADGRTVLFIGHRLDEVREIADRVLVLRNGRWSPT